MDNNYDDEIKVLSLSSDSLLYTSHWCVVVIIIIIVVLFVFVVLWDIIFESYENIRRTNVI